MNDDRTLPIRVALLEQSMKNLTVDMGEITNDVRSIRTTIDKSSGSLAAIIFIASAVSPTILWLLTHFFH
jgi:hypothetical protein